MIRDLSRRLRPALRLARWQYLRWVLAAAMVPPALWACNAHPLEAPDPNPETQIDQYLEVNPIRDVDIVFMIDNSPSMMEEQENLARNFPAFIDELKKIPGGLPNVHIGVISSDVGAGPTSPGQCRPGGDRGLFRVNPGCGLDANQARYLVALNNGAMKNFTGEIETVFSCMAKLGVNGCGYEHQLQSARVALAKPEAGGPPQNQGFLRDQAYLALIFVTDEDDCSAPPNTDLFSSDDRYRGQAPSLRCSLEGHTCGGKPVTAMDGFSSAFEQCKPTEGGKLIALNEFANYFRGLKGNRPDKVIVSGIIGWPGETAVATYQLGKTAGSADIDNIPTCSSQGGSATAGIRMKGFVDAMGGQVYSICQNDFRPAMQGIGKALAAKLGNTCVNAPVVDTRLDVDGIQADCAISDRNPMGTGFQTVPLPECSTAGAQRPCWKLSPNPECTASGYKIEVDRGGAMAAQGAQLAMKCLTCSKPDDPRCKR